MTFKCGCNKNICFFCNPHSTTGVVRKAKVFNTKYNLSPFTWSHPETGVMCQYCKDHGIEHKVESRKLTEDEREERDRYRTNHLYEPATMRECSGCKRKDGPWVEAYY